MGEGERAWQMHVCWCVCVYMGSKSDCQVPYEHKCTHGCLYLYWTDTKGRLKLTSRDEFQFSESTSAATSQGKSKDKMELWLLLTLKSLKDIEIRLCWSEKEKRLSDGECHDSLMGEKNPMKYKATTT